MKTLLNFALILMASLPLIACSYFDGDDEMSLDTTPPAAETIDLTRNQPAETMTGPGGLELQTLQPPPKIEDVVNTSSKGSVEMYPSDMPPLQQAQGAVPSGTYSFGDARFKPIEQPVDTVSAVPVDNPSPMISMDPSVEVFPLDGPVQGSGTNMTVVNASTGDVAVVYFDRSDTGLDSSDQEKLAGLANGQIAQGIVVEGFASTESLIKDPLKRKVENLKVSMDRAYAVAKALIEKGVPADLITAVGYGENRPGPDPEGSRRVEIHGLSGH